VRRDQLVHPSQVIQIGVEVVEEDRVQEHAADLSERRTRKRIVRSRLAQRERAGSARRAHADRQQAGRAEPDRGAERRDQTHAAVAEPELARARV